MTTKSKTFKKYDQWINFGLPNYKLRRSYGTVDRLELYVYRDLLRIDYEAFGREPMTDSTQDLCDLYKYAGEIETLNTILND